MSFSSIFNADRTAYQLNEQGIPLLIDDGKILLGDTYEQCESDNTMTVLLEAFVDMKSKGKTEISLTEFVELFKAYRRTGRIKSNADLAEEQAEAEAEAAAQQVKETPPDNRPRGKDGHVLSEYEIFYLSQPSREIRERIKADPEFATFARSQMHSELGKSEDGTPQSATTDVHPALKKFVQQYQGTPASRLKPVAGYVTVADGTRFTIQKFNELVAEASAARLI